MKQCTKCKIKKSLFDFYILKSSKDGHRNVCKTCQYKAKPHRSPKESSFIYLYNICKNAAIFREIVFNLTTEQHRNIITKNCYHCGAVPIQYNPYVSKHIAKKPVSKKRLSEAWILKNGIDRLDNSIGYVESNCVPCCQKCNYGKQDYTLEEYIKHSYDVVNYQEAKKNAKT